MASLTQKAVAAIIAVTGIAAVSPSAEAASYQHIDRGAMRLVRQANQLSREFRIHYRHTSEYRHLMADAATLRRLANHVHEMAHRGTLSHMASDLQQLDRAFHHLERTVRRIERNGGYGHHGYGGHIDGNTSDVRRMLRRMKNSLHHLQNDINETLYPPVHDHGDFGFDSGYYSPRYRSRGVGFSYRKGRFGIRIGH